MRERAECARRRAADHAPACDFRKASRPVLGGAGETESMETVGGLFGRLAVSFGRQSGHAGGHLYRQSFFRKM